MKPHRGTVRTEPKSKLNSFFRFIIVFDITWGVLATWANQIGFAVVAFSFAALQIFINKKRPDYRRYWCYN